jgi:hypothetical protein
LKKGVCCRSCWPERLRDDGPLPDTITDMNARRMPYAAQLKGAGALVICLGSMLHSIATGTCCRWVKECVRGHSTRRSQPKVEPTAGDPARRFGGGGRRPDCFLDLLANPTHMMNVEVYGRTRGYAPRRDVDAGAAARNRDLAPETLSDYEMKNREAGVHQRLPEDGGGGGGGFAGFRQAGCAAHLIA